jgi:type IV secretion system protein VirB6
MSVVAEFIRYVDSTLIGFTESTYDALVASHQTEILLVLTIYVALYGWAVLNAWIETTLTDAVKRVLFLVVVVTLATQWSYFSLFGYDVFTTGPAKMIAAVTHGAVDPSALLDQVFEKGIRAGYRLMQEGGWSDMGLVVIGAVVVAGTVITVGYSLFLIVLAKIALAILLGLAPLFLLFLLFNATRDFFAQWLRQLFNFALIPVLVFGVSAVMLKFVDASLTRLETATTSRLGEVTFLLLIGFILVMLLRQVMGIAAGLGGGIQLATLGMTSRLGGMFSGAGTKLGTAFGRAGWNNAITQRLRASPLGQAVGQARDRVRSTVGLRK